MEEILQFDRVSKYDTFHHQENLHPCQCYRFYRNTAYGLRAWMKFGFYAVFLKDYHAAILNTAEVPMITRTGRWSLSPRVSQLVSDNERLQASGFRASIPS